MPRGIFRVLPGGVGELRELVAVGHSGEKNARVFFGPFTLPCGSLVVKWNGTGGGAVPLGA